MGGVGHRVSAPGPDSVTDETVSDLAVATAGREIRSLFSPIWPYLDPPGVTPSDSVAPAPLLALTSSLSAADLEPMRGGLRIIALRALGDPDAADEAVQETLARAVIAIGDGRVADPAKLAAYVAGIARHVCSHIHRDRKDTLSLDSDDSSAVIDRDPGLAVHSDPLDALITEAEQTQLRAAFRALSPADQRVLRECFDDSRASDQAASNLMAASDRLRKRKSRALDRLRRIFLGHDGQSRGTG